MPVLLLTEGHDIPSGRTFDMINCTIDQQDITVPKCRSHRIPCRTHSLSESRYKKNCQHTDEKKLHSPYNNIFCPGPAPVQFFPGEMQRRNAKVPFRPQNEDRRGMPFFSFCAALPAFCYYCFSSFCGNLNPAYTLQISQSILQKRDNIQFCNCPSHGYYFTNSFTFAAFPTRFLK